jgi:hypothetical protein
MPTVQTKPDLVLYLVLPGEVLMQINETHVIPKDAQQNWCLTLRESPDAAWERSSWFTGDQERFLLRVTLTTKGIGHYTRDGTDAEEPLLSRVPSHGTWRFHTDMPFLVEDTDGHVLFQVEHEMTRVIGPR